MKKATGQVISTKMTHTATVAVVTSVYHPLYRKTLTRSRKYAARNLIGAKQKDTVVIQATRPLSRKIHWQIVEVIK